MQCLAALTVNRFVPQAAASLSFQFAMLRIRNVKTLRIRNVRRQYGREGIGEGGLEKKAAAL